jgi:hypothetical protein
MLCIFNTLLRIFNTYLLTNICGSVTVMAKNTSKKQENPTLSWFFKVLTKTQVNTKSPKSHNLNPTLTKTSVFHQVDCRVGTWLTLLESFPHRTITTMALVSGQTLPGMVFNLL